MAKMMDELEALELAAHLLGIDADSDTLDEQVEEKIYERYQIEFHSFRVLASELLPMCDIGQSAITKQLFRGFSIREEKHGRWLAKVDA
jgi:hypothetical protein